MLALLKDCMQAEQGGLVARDTARIKPNLPLWTGVQKRAVCVHYCKKSGSFYLLKNQMKPVFANFLINSEKFVWTEEGYTTQLLKK